jgi:predicted MFS family arabinose efflux permease
MVTPSEGTRIAAAQFLILQAMTVNLVLPIYLGGLVDVGNFPESQLGLMANAISAGTALTTLGLAPLMGRVNRQLACALAIAFDVIVNLLSCSVRSPGELLVLRALDGAAMGILLAVGFAYLGQCSHPERQFGLNFALQVVIQCVAQITLPYLFASTGMSGFYLLLVAMTVFSAWAIWMMPPYARAASPVITCGPATAVPIDWRLATLSLAANSIFYVYITPIYTFSQRIGASLGLGPERLGLGIGLTTLAGTLGSLAALVLADRWGRRIPLWLGIPVALAPCILLYRPSSEQHYWIGLALFSITWSYYLPYLLGIVALADPVGRLMAVAQGLPLVTGMVGVAASERFATHGVLQQVPLVAAAGFVVCLVVALWALTQQAQSSRRAQVVSGG